MIARVSRLRPQEVIVEHSPQLEVKGISIYHETFGKMYIIAVYKRQTVISVISLFPICISGFRTIQDCTYCGPW